MLCGSLLPSPSVPMQDLKSMFCCAGTYKKGRPRSRPLSSAPEALTAAVPHPLRHLSATLHHAPHHCSAPANLHPSRPGRACIPSAPHTHARGRVEQPVRRTPALLAFRDADAHAGAARSARSPAARRTTKRCARRRAGSTAAPALRKTSATSLRSAVSASTAGLAASTSRRSSRAPSRGCGSRMMGSSSTGHFQKWRPPAKCLPLE